jgi:hypothetical protein
MFHRIYKVMYNFSWCCLYNYILEIESWTIMITSINDASHQLLVHSKKKTTYCWLQIVVRDGQRFLNPFVGKFWHINRRNLAIKWDDLNKSGCSVGLLHPRVAYVGHATIARANKTIIKKKQKACNVVR